MIKINPIKWIKNSKINLVLGILIGTVISQIIITEGYAILIAYSSNGSSVQEITKESEFAIRILAITFFIITIFIFNTKIVKKINFNRISIYLLIAVIISVVLTVYILYTIICIIVIITLENTRIDNITDVITNNYFLSINYVIFTILLACIIFLLIFTALVNTKVKYIKHLTEEVKVIKNEGFGKTIKVKGNDELADLCKSINEMSIELREKIDKEKTIEKNKNELITNVSHDLRTPLTSIMGYIDLLKKNGFSNKDNFEEYINIIDERTKNLNKLINELFEYTKLSNNDITFNFVKVELGGLLEQLIGEYIPIFKKTGLEIQKNIEIEDVFINVDVEKIIRVLENLLTNALKYSESNSVVNLNLFKESSNAVITLTNKVSNISLEEVDNLFERLYKVEKSRMNNESSGLGLSIVKKIVELHNGSVKATLIQDNIEFKVKLPLENDL